MLERLGFRARFAIAHQVGVLLVLAATGLATWWTLSRAVHEQLDAALLAVADTELNLIADARSRGDVSPVRTHDVPAAPAAPFYERLDRLVQIVDGEGRVLARSANLGAARLPMSPSALAAVQRGEPMFQTITDFGDEPTRLLTLPVPPAGGRDAARAIQVAGSLDDVDRVLRSVGGHFVAMGVALMLVVGGAGMLLTRRVFGAIDEVVRQARGIGDPTASRRLPHPGTHDEIARLVETLNGMLDRLEHAFEGQRRFTADASHELRSPLSRLRTELELSLRRPRDASSYVETLRSCLDEVERLTLFVDELLVLARLDAGEERGPTESVQLEGLAREALSRVEGSARDRDIALLLDHDAATPASALVPRGAAIMVLGNLLDNALKFSPRGCVVTLRVRCERGEAVVQVEDSGPGIGRLELPYLFDRFYRSPGVRAGETAGVGLGLSICRTIVQAHGGAIEAGNREQGGACFTVRLPVGKGGG